MALLWIKLALNFKRNPTKFLGVFVDDSLSWRYHLTHVNNKISRALYGIKQVKNFLPKDSLKTLYLAFIQPYISYGIFSWGNTNISTLKKTISLQKRAIRIINNTGYNYPKSLDLLTCMFIKSVCSCMILLIRNFLILSIACSV